MHDRSNLKFYQSDRISRLNALRKTASQLNYQNKRTEMKPTFHAEHCDQKSESDFNTPEELHICEEAALERCLLPGLLAANEAIGLSVFHRRCYPGSARFRAELLGLFNEL
ncbi:hypothetical protein CDAR_454461 [Caerostris darwini]|uniref:Uncharacterized protein n=1 Tax=Caerostris darwini TaxID=1538125 RepID=A0AAV4V8P5_9ARAC|nr:hypothetical protein CDAR_454461 [Caerostris darwini]